MNKILLVEDEATVVSFIKKGLSEEGFEVSVAFDGKTGLKMYEDNTYQLLILDIMLPEMNGLDLCKHIRKKDKSIPIIFLTALGTSENVVLGLDTGADDYLVKPFKFIELVARIRNLLRRSERAAPQEVSAQQEYLIQFEDLILNDYTKTVKRKDKEISLTSTEYRLLQFFMQNPYRVLSRLDILDAVWGVNYDMGTNVVDVYVNYLRKKLERDGLPKLIQTVIGMGYVLKSE